MIKVYIFNKSSSILRVYRMYSVIVRLWYQQVMGAMPVNVRRLLHQLLPVALVQC